MKPVDFAYAQPRELSEAVTLLSLDDTAKIMAGGQTLGPMLNLRLAQPGLVVDISRIPELVRVEDRADGVVLGACITHAAIEDGRVPDPTRGMLAHVAAGIAYRAVRTRGTIGGSLAHADPAADWLSCLTALGASVSISGPRGRRDMGVSDFVRGVMETALAPDDVLDGVYVPRLGPGARWGYHKICRKTGEFADAIGAVVSSNGATRLVAGATGGRAIIIDVASDDLASAAFSPSVLGQALGANGITDDIYALNVHTKTLRRAIEGALAA